MPIKPYKATTPETTSNISLAYDDEGNVLNLDTGGYGPVLLNGSTVIGNLLDAQIFSHALRSGMFNSTFPVLSDVIFPEYISPIVEPISLIINFPNYVAQFASRFVPEKTGIPYLILQALLMKDAADAAYPWHNHSDQPIKYRPYASTTYDPKTGYHTTYVWDRAPGEESLESIYPEFDIISSLPAAKVKSSFNNLLKDIKGLKELKIYDPSNFIGFTGVPKEKISLFEAVDPKIGTVPMPILRNAATIPVANPANPYDAYFNKFNNFISNYNYNLNKSFQNYHLIDLAKDEKKAPFIFTTDDPMLARQYSKGVFGYGTDPNGKVYAIFSDLKVIHAPKIRMPDAGLKWADLLFKVSPDGKFVNLPYARIEYIDPTISESNVSKILKPLRTSTTDQAALTLSNITNGTLLIPNVFDGDYVITLADGTTRHIHPAMTEGIVLPHTPFRAVDVTSTLEIPDFSKRISDASNAVIARKWDVFGDMSHLALPSVRAGINYTNDKINE